MNTFTTEQNININITSSKRHNTCKRLNETNKRQLKAQQEKTLVHLCTDVRRAGSRHSTISPSPAHAATTLYYSSVHAPRTGLWCQIIQLILHTQNKLPLEFRLVLCCREGIYGWWRLYGQTHVMFLYILCVVDLCTKLLQPNFLPGFHMRID